MCSLPGARKRFSKDKHGNMLSFKHCLLLRLWLRSSFGDTHLRRNLRKKQHGGPRIASKYLQISIQITMMNDNVVEMINSETYCDRCRFESIECVVALKVFHKLSHRCICLSDSKQISRKRDEHNGESTEWRRERKRSDNKKHEKKAETKHQTPQRHYCGTACVYLEHC